MSGSAGRRASAKTKLSEFWRGVLKSLTCTSGQRAKVRKGAYLESLESRVMLSGGIEGALVDTELLACENSSQAPVASEVALLEEAHQTVLIDLSGSADPHPEMQSDLLEGLATRELVFVDKNLKDYQQVVADLQGSHSNRNVEVVALESDRNGIEQVSEILSERSNLTAVHFISHGADGQINLGNTWLNSTTLQQNINAISAWGKAMTESGDILFYGCNIATHSDGQGLLANIAGLTGADVAASDDPTGSTTLGADWVLEYCTGVIETTVAFSPEAQQHWSGSLATFTVNTTNDSGLGSLRQAITDANALGGADTIAFAIGFGAQTISLASALPEITDQVTIDGWTQPGFAGSPLIRIDGGLAGAGVDGLTLSGTADASVIRGLMMTRFTRDGIAIQSGADNITIAGNWIGTTGAGSTGVGNADDGIDISGSTAIIGGTGANDRNVITNSGDEGIDIVGSGVTGHLIQGNYIGVDPDGASGGGNADVGIAIISGSGNTIGGTAVEARNVISRNKEGIEINTSNNVVQGNYIGTDAGGTLPCGNRADDGVEIRNGSTGNRIGGTAAGAGNLIAFNALDGVNVVDGSGHSVLGNRIYSNSQLGIDLVGGSEDASGVTANDVAPDADTGANNLQNFPVLTSATTNGSQITITGALASNASSYYRIEFFSSSAADGSGHGEGQTYLGFANIATDGAGNAAINAVLTTVVPAGAVVSATATKSDAGFTTFTDTSEFAQNITAVAANTAPTLSNGTLASINEDTINPSGQAVSAIFAGQFSDPDAGASFGGIAVVGNTADAGTQGSWQYSTNAGSNWFAIGTVADGATALALSSSTLIRFVPVAGYNGTPPSLVVRGLDNTHVAGYSATAGSETRVSVDTTSNGGMTAIAAVSANLSTSITAVNDAPVAADDRPALSFDGVDDYVSVPDSASLIMGSTMTLEAWINPDFSSNSVQMIANKEGEYELSIFANGSLNFAFAEGGSWNWHNTGATIPRNAWTHVAVTYNAGLVTTYVNGVLVDSQSMATTTIDDVYQSLDELRIGGRSNNPANQYFDGRIAEVRVWSVARTGAEIAGAMNSTLTGSESGLAAYLPLDDNTGLTATDKTANGNSGTLVNGAAWSGYRINEDTVLSAVVPGVLGNDYDADGDTLTAVLVSGPANGSLSLNANGSFVYTPNADWNGTDSFTYRANDGTVSGNVATVTIVVNRVNDAPVLAAIGNQSVNEGATLGFTASATDADLPADTLTYSLDAASLALGMTINGSTGAFSWTPTEAQGGLTPSVTISVTDNGTGNLFDSETFTITVGDVNVAPVLAAIGNQSVNEGATLSFSASATDADLPADTLTYSLDAASLALGMTINGSTGAFSWTPTEAQGGLTPSVTITVTDNGTGSLFDSETFFITVTDINVAPVLGAIGNQTVDELVTLTFTATATDSDLPANTLAFTLDAASIALGMSIDANTGVFTWTPTEAQGSLTPSVTITVTDNGTGSLMDSETFFITVTDINVAPVVTSAALTVNEGQTVTLSPANFGITDPDDNAFNYTVSGISGGYFQLSTAPGTPITSFTSADLAGNLVQFVDDGNEIAPDFSVTVNDGDANSNTLASTITYNPVNDAPVGLPAITGSVTEGQTLIADTSGISDADGLGAFSYQWLRNGVAIAGATNSTYTLGDADVGTQIRVQVSYTDGHGTAESVTSAQTAAVANVNDVPTGLPIIVGTATQPPTITPNTGGSSGMGGLGSTNDQSLQNGAANAVGMNIFGSGDTTLSHGSTGSAIGFSNVGMDGNDPGDGPFGRTKDTPIEEAIKAAGTDDSIRSLNQGGPLEAMKNQLNLVTDRTVDPFWKEPQRHVSDAEAMISNESIQRELDGLKRQLEESSRPDELKEKLMVGMASGIGGSFFVGYVVWALRGTSLLASALASLPLWRCFDPLPVFWTPKRRRRKRDTEGENIEKARENEKDVEELFSSVQGPSVRTDLKGTGK